MVSRGVLRCAVLCPVWCASVPAAAWPVRLQLGRWRLPTVPPAVRVVLAAVPAVQESSEELFEVLACYFPIAFTPPPNDPNRCAHGLQLGAAPSYSKCTLDALPCAATASLPVHAVSPARLPARPPAPRLHITRVQLGVLLLLQLPSSILTTLGAACLPACPPPACSITREQLAAGLEAVLAAEPRFAPHLVPLIMEKLSSSIRWVGGEWLWRGVVSLARRCSDP